MNAFRSSSIITIFPHPNFPALNTAPFKVYDASAGSGKTYNLIYNILHFCLKKEEPLAFRKILAITFTNKAAAEMKTRLLQTLREFSKYPDSGRSLAMIEALAADIQTEAEVLRERSQKLLRTILHQYSALSVGTIDSFTNNLIRSFANDLNINVNYEVELESHMILSEAIDLMLSELRENSAGSEVLIDFLNNQLEEGKSPQAEHILLNFAQTLFDEDAREPLQLLESLNTADFLRIQRDLRARRKQIVDELKALAAEIEGFLQSHHLSEDLFRRYTLPEHLQKIRLSHDIPPMVDTLLKCISGETEWYTKAKAKVAAPLFDSVALELQSYGNRLQAFMDQYWEYFQISGLILHKLTGLAVLGEVRERLEEIKLDTNRLPIGEFNHIISDKLQDQPAAFLYEKLGERYQQFFIDEFQDTSRLQWQNLKPLINNSLAGGGGSMLVGDGKQSIYRFRGGDVEQFLALIENVDPSNTVQVGDQLIELYQRELIRLPHNWRSRKNIVDFNNRFFTALIGAESNKGEQALNSEIHRKMYQAAAQQVKGREGGYVEIYNLGDEKMEQAHCEYVYQKIMAVREQGYRWSDIALLYRNNVSSMLLTDYLVRRSVPIISPDGLVLRQSPEVRALISFLHIMHFPEDKNASLDFLRYLWDHHTALPAQFGERHLFFRHFLTLPKVRFEEALQKLFPDFQFRQLASLGLYEKLFYIAYQLQLPIQENVFLQKLLDEAARYTKHHQDETGGFLQWWSVEGHKRAVELSPALDAVRLMTIHKSKGLEFPVVILAFAHWHAFVEKNSKTWLRLPPDEYAGLPAALVSLKNIKGPVLEDYNNTYLLNRQAISLDNLNLLYVALTRAVDQLYIVSSGEWDTNNRISTYFRHFLKDEEVVEGKWSLGIPETRPPSTPLPAPRRPDFVRVDWRQRLQVIVPAPKNWEEGESGSTAWGKKVHHILSLLQDGSRLEEIIQKEIQAGHFPREEYSELQRLIEEVIAMPALRKHFQQGVKILNEREIWLPGGGLFRPDRLIIDGNKVHIIDYKTGVQRESDREQLRQYGLILSQMGYETAEQLLVYLHNPVQVVSC